MNKKAKEFAIAEIIENYGSEQKLIEHIARRSKHSIEHLKILIQIANQ
jgi:hypothetical protein